MPSMQTTTSRDNFWGQLYFQNVLNFGKLACSIKRDIENIFIHFLFLAIVPSSFRGYFLGPKFFLVGISWVQNIFSWAFHRFKTFSRGYLVGPKFSLVGNFVIFSCWPHKKKWHRNISQTTYSISNRSQQL